MNIVDELINLLNIYNEPNPNQIERDDCNGRPYGDIRFPVQQEVDSGHRVHRTRVSNPVYITYSEAEHSFFVEPQQCISFEDLQKIRDHYTGTVSQNKNYSNVIGQAYNITQLDKDINNNWDYDVYRQICMLLDMAIHLFERCFELESESYEGHNLYFYPADIQRIIDDENRFKEHEKQNYLNGINSSETCYNELKDILNNSYSNEKDIEDDILSAFCCLYQKDYKELKRWSSEKAGFGIGGHIAVTNLIWDEIKDYWDKILVKYPNVFSSTRFAKNSLYIKSYGDYNNNLVDAINDILSSSDIGLAWINFHGVVYATFYGRPLDD